MSDWVTAWTASPQRPSAGFAANWSENGFIGQTIRQTVRLGAGGDAVRVRLTNRYGATPLRIAGMSVSTAVGTAAIKPESLLPLTVNGKRDVVVPAGSELHTDPSPLRSEPLDAVTVTLYLAEPSGPATYHAQALATTYRADGDHVADTDAMAFTDTSESWYFLAALEVTGTPANGIVVFGDSLTDGTGSTPDTDQRFPDLLALRLLAAGRPRPVLNQGIGGNRVTIDSSWLGERATRRFPDDVLTHSGVGTVMILAGINDIGISELAGTSPFPVLAPYTDVSADAIIAGHRGMIRRAREAGLRVVGSTLLPIAGAAYSTTRSEAKRAAVNNWIRNSGQYDAVADLAAAIGEALAPDHDSGDGLHLNAVTASCPITAPVRWSRAATRCGAVVVLDRAPRTVLPSRAITRRVATVWVRVHRAAPMSWSRRSESRRANTRRMVDSSGTVAPVIPRTRRVSIGWWATHSPIATNDFAPPMTAASPTARTDAKVWRRPRRARGSGTDFNRSSSCDRQVSASAAGRQAVVGEDDMDGCGSPAGRFV
jgi:lysophospholipase L1-like esterase